MTFGQLLDQIVHGSGDDTGAYRTAALRWLNLTRSEISTMARWHSAFSVSTFTTAASNTTGVYAIFGFEHISGDYLYDETNGAVIRYEGHETLQATDPERDTFGPPVWWSDAGTDLSGFRQVLLRPIPDATYAIRFAGFRNLFDITAAQESASIDSYFGNLNPWASAFVAGMRYYAEVDDNTDPAQSALFYQQFMRLVRLRMAQNQISLSTIPAQDVRATGQVATGRFDPAHFNNRG